MITEVKFTEGPWVVGRANIGDGVGVQAEWGVGFVVCDICDDIDDDHIANAHLIAAAPELYEFIERMVECGVFYHGDEREAIALLAKARGE